MAMRCRYQVNEGTSCWQRNVSGNAVAIETQHYGSATGMGWTHDVHVLWQCDGVLHWFYRRWRLITTSLSVEILEGACRDTLLGKDKNLKDIAT